MATIKEVAEMAQVSAAAVSRVLNKDDSISVSPEVRARIFQAAHALGYVSPRQRRANAQKTHLVIGVADWRIVRPDRPNVRLSTLSCLVQMMTDQYEVNFVRLASGQVDVLCTYADARRDYEDEWTGEYAMTNSIWEDTAVIGVTPAIYNDTISVSKTSPIMDDDFKAALSEAFINIGNTEEGKEVIAIYSHNGYQPAQSSDYDSERAAQEMIQSLNSAG